MELHELHVADFSAGAIGHRNSVTGGDGRIRSFLVDMAETASCKQHSRRSDGMHLPIFAQQIHANDTTIFDQQVGGKFEFANGDVLDGFCLEVKRAANLLSGGVAMCVQDAVATMGAFASEREFGPIAIELCSPGDELFNALRSFFDENARGLLIAKAVAGNECVLQVQADFIFVAERGGDASLCILCSRLLDFKLGEDEHASR